MELKLDYQLLWCKICFVNVMFNKCTLCISSLLLGMLLLFTMTVCLKRQWKWEKLCSFWYLQNIYFSVGAADKKWISIIHWKLSSKLVIFQVKGSWLIFFFYGMWQSTFTQNLHLITTSKYLQFITECPLLSILTLHWISQWNIVHSTTFSRDIETA